MTNKDDTIKGAVFKRGIHNPKFIEALQDLTTGSKWWGEVLADNTLIIAVRDEYLNVYWQGQSLFRIDYHGGICMVTHPKYLLDPSLKDLVPFKADCFHVPESGFLMQTWKHGDTLKKMKKVAGLYAGREKKGVHQIVFKNLADLNGRQTSDVVDVEITLRRQDPQQGERKLPRIDIAALEQDGDKIRLVFWEAKLFSNGDLRAAGSKNPPGVLKQIDDYKSILDAQRKNVLDSYKQVAKNLVTIAAMRKTLDPSHLAKSVAGDVSCLMNRVSENPELLTMAACPDVRLLVFDYDDDQANGSGWAPHKAKLNNALGKRFKFAGKAKDLRLGVKP